MHQMRILVLLSLSTYKILSGPAYHWHAADVNKNLIRRPRPIDRVLPAPAPVAPAPGPIPSVPGDDW